MPSAVFALALAAFCIGTTEFIISGILLPMSLAPLWLQRVSDLIPVKHIVTGIRDLFADAVWGSGVLWAVVWAAVLVVAGLWIGTRTFRRQNA